MKTSFIGYRYGSYTTDHGYKMHEVQFFKLETFGGRGTLWSNDLFTVRTQTDSDHGLSFWKSYAPRIEAAQLREDAYKAIRPFVGMIGLSDRTAREMVAAIKKLKSVKVTYNTKESSFLPRRFKHIPEVYFAALKNNLDIK